ncbi:MAG: hypothetical protein WBP85_13250 [Terracidiphilus sp.]
MATCPTMQALPIRTASPAPTRGRGTVRRRRISPEAGRAIEILGHAIEYLTDEFVHAGGSFSGPDPQVEAVELLMSLNRKIYFECPEVTGFADRLRAWVHPRPA